MVMVRFQVFKKREQRSPDKKAEIRAEALQMAAKQAASLVVPPPAPVLPFYHRPAIRFWTLFSIATLSCAVFAVLFVVAPQMAGGGMWSLGRHILIQGERLGLIFTICFF